MCSQRVFACTFVSRPCIAKERFRKSYRHPELDERLTQRRLLQEARSIARARRCGVAAPAVYLIDRPSATIFMERIDGLPVRQCIDENRIAGRVLTPDSPFFDFLTLSLTLSLSHNSLCLTDLVTLDPNALAISIGSAIAQLHDSGLIHGDRTTSNMLVHNTTGELVRRQRVQSQTQTNNVTVHFCFRL